MSRIDPINNPGIARFDPDPVRARHLDRRMRERLVASLRYVADKAAGKLTLPSDAALQSLFARIASGPVSPQVFGAYYDLVLAIDDDDRHAAEGIFSDLLMFSDPDNGLRVVDLGDFDTDPHANRYRRQIDTDPTMPFEIFPPPADMASACRRRIAAAMELIEKGNPQLAAEIRTLLREVVLAVGPSGPGAVIFDGASSFMLWGGIVLNANAHETTLDMVQALAHESAHNLLFGLSADGPLVENEDDERYASPLRQDPRPLDGIYHATFVCARMHQAVKRLVDAGVLSDKNKIIARKDLVTTATLFADGHETVSRHARLTPVGKAAMAGARDYMAAHG